jgi:hypothetical protein
MRIVLAWQDDVIKAKDNLVFCHKNFSNLKDCTIEIINELAHQIPAILLKQTESFLQDFALICPHIECIEMRVLVIHYKLTIDSYETINQIPLQNRTGMSLTNSFTSKKEYQTIKSDPFMQALASGGFQVEELARLHPNGVL